MVQNSMDGLLHVRATRTLKSKGVLSTTVLAHELTTLTPDAKGVMRCINDAVVDKLWRQSARCPAWCSGGAFTPLFEGLENHQGFQGTHAHDPPQLTPTPRAEFSRFVESSSRRASSTCYKQFEDLRVVYKVGLFWNQEEYEQKPKDLPTFRADMRVQRNWVGATSTRCGGWAAR